MTVHTRAFRAQPATLDREARTVEAIVSTGAEVQRPGYLERLDLRGADLSRLIGGPVLDSHRSSSTRDVLGIVEAAELRPEGLWVRIRFRSNEAAQAVLADIGDGTLGGLSVGYSVSKWNEKREGNRRLRIAAKWTPLEVSVVPVPADPGAYFRNGATGMNTEDLTAEAPPSDEPPQTRAQANSEIRAMAETAGLARAWADAQIDAEATPEAARVAAFDAMQTRARATQTRTARAVITADHDDPAVIATRAGEALYARSHPEHQLSPQARPWAHMSVVDLARDCLRRTGAPVTGLAADTVITRALGGLHSTSDFPAIMGDAVGRELRRAYAAAPAGIRQVARQSTVRDFRARKAIAFGTAPGLEKVGEHGEFTHGTIGESAESYRVETYGRIFGITRQALVNDDLGAFSTIPAKLGAAAIAFEAGQLAAVVADNPTMADGQRVFDKTHHANQDTAASGGDTAVDDFKTNLGKAKLALRKQTGLGGELIDVVPRFVIVPPELEVTAQQALAEVQATTSAEVNPFTGLTLIVDPRLTSTTQFYVAADPAQIDGIEYAHLEGAPGPQIETRAGFDVDGVQFRLRLDFGCGWLDWRGWFRVG